MKLKLKSEMKEAMKAKDKVRLNTIRAILSAIQYQEMEKNTEELSEEAVLVLLKNESKKRNESLQFAKDAGREQEVQELNQEIAIVESFLPAQLSETDLEKILLDLKNNQPDINMGIAMKNLKENYPGQYDGKMASTLAKKILG